MKEKTRKLSFKKIVVAAMGGGIVCVVFDFVATEFGEGVGLGLGILRSLLLATVILFVLRLLDKKYPDLK